jgi:hypothetical protein
MCGRTILPADVANHPRCDGCSTLLEPELNEKTICRCGKLNPPPDEGLTKPVWVGTDSRPLESL